MTSIAQRKVLLGRESPSGTPATPDTCIRAKAELAIDSAKIRPEESIGSFAPARNYVGSVRGAGSLQYDGYYEHLPIVVSMATGDPLSGGTPNVISGGRYRYSFTLAESGVYLPQYITYTMEYTDGDQHIVRASDVFATSMQVSGQAGKSWQFKLGLVGSQTSFPVSLGATLEPIQKVTPILMAETLVYAADAYNNIALVDTKLINFSWRLGGYQHQKLFAGALYPTGKGNGQHKITLDLTVEVATAFVQSEKAKLLTPAQTAIRLRSVSPNAHGPGLDYLINMDGVYTLRAVQSLTDRNGNNTVKLTYEGEKNTDGFIGRFFMDTDLAQL